ncbi:hypothetical protein LIER_40054 [Lithospermum erythrorhizon]|uniref:Uncharacterized protein n=1 Tax=Lithospermum erythrorhizon TaxID=34254 RepID=A0AAV3QNZ7_LITER
MASSDETPEAMPQGDGSVPPGKPMTMGQHLIDKGTQIAQTMQPIKQMTLHACTFSSYSHDMSRLIEAHHLITRLSQDFLQCAVYDSDHSDAKLIGIEYIVSTKVFETLPPEEQKLWHSHGFEVTSGLWVNPRFPEMFQKSELQDLAQTYGKFWCTWQVDRGDILPLGAPALMMSPQGVNLGMVPPEMIKKRDERYKLSCESLMAKRADIVVPQSMNLADYWMKSDGKGFAIDIEPTDMKEREPFP